jgi:hypothetical protein
MYSIGTRSEKFQEAFERFEKVVDVDSFESYRELWYAFRHWAGKRWRNTEPQNRALAYDGERLHLPDIAMPKAFGHTVKETKKIMKRRMAKEIAKARKAKRAKKQIKVFSRRYSSYNLWLKHETRTTAYQRRIIRYMQKHPNASLREARGHRIKPTKTWKKRAKKYTPKKIRKKRR